MTPEPLAREAVALAESMDYVMADGRARLAMMTNLLDRRPQSSADASPLLSEWCLCYEEYFGTTYGLGQPDRQPAEQLLAEAPLREILHVARMAWNYRDDTKRHPHCQFSTTLAGLAKNLDRIRLELGLEA